MHKWHRYVVGSTSWKLSFLCLLLSYNYQGSGFYTFPVLLCYFLPVLSAKVMIYVIIFVSPRNSWFSLSPEVFGQRLFYLISFCHKGQCHCVSLSSISVLFCLSKSVLRKLSSVWFKIGMLRRYMWGTVSRVRHFKEHTGILYKLRYVLQYLFCYFCSCLKMLNVVVKRCWCYFCPFIEGSSDVNMTNLRGFQSSWL